MGDEVQLNHDDPAAIEAASMARSLIKAKVDDDSDFFDLVARWCGITELPAVNESPEAIIERGLWLTAIIACLAKLGAVALLTALEGMDSEETQRHITDWLESMERRGVTFRCASTDSGTQSGTAGS